MHYESTLLNKYRDERITRNDRPVTDPRLLGLLTRHQKQGARRAPCSSTARRQIPPPFYAAKFLRIYAAGNTTAPGHYLPVEVAIQFQYSRRTLSRSNGRYSASKLTTTLPRLGRVEMWRGSSRFGLSDPSLSSDGAQVALP